MNESHQRKRLPQEQEQSNRPQKRQNKAPKTPKEAPRGAALSKLDFDKFCPEEGTNNPTINDFRSLWKVCLRVFGWSPVMLISPIHGLKYRSVAKRAQQSGFTHVTVNSEPLEEPYQADPAEHLEQPQSSKGNSPSEVIFPPDFSRLLTSLIVHPCWEYDPMLLILALQYTVKCRVDNKDPWPRAGFWHLDTSLEALVSMFNDPDREPVGVAEMLAAVQNSQAEDGRSTFMRFLHFLGGKVKSTTSDTTAVTEFDWGQDSWNCSPDEVWRAYRDEEVYSPKLEGCVSRDCASDTTRGRADASSPMDSLETPQQRTEEGADIPVEDILNTPVEDMAEERRRQADVPREPTPFHQRVREPRREALVGGEEIEDEGEDLERNWRSEDVSNETRVIQGAGRRDQIDKRIMSGRSFPSPYNPHVAPTSFASQPLRLTPLTYGASRLTLSQSVRDEERFESRFTRSETSIKALEDENIRILNTQRSHGEAIRDLQRRLELQIRQAHEAESVNVATRRLGVLEKEMSDLFQQNQALQKRVDQMVKDAEKRQTEWSGKVHALELENSTLLVTMAQKEEGFKAEISRVSDEQTRSSRKERVLEQDNWRLLDMVAEKEESLALERQKARALEAELTSIKNAQRNSAPSMGVPVQPSSLLVPQSPTYESLISRNRTPLAQYSTPNPYTTVESQGGEVPSLEGKVNSQTLSRF
ncbi:hypothetical protein FPRO04_07509 [Fusarium proliferatum]|nr:hypothetical protein FPRO03_13140 [Fusarium proliferatum]KAG4277212.1 hypothetical protein FPRO04_07509 [Fusarium proliferatum]